MYNSICWAKRDQRPYMYHHKSAVILWKWPGCESALIKPSPALLSFSSSPCEGDSRLNASISRRKAAYFSRSSSPATGRQTRQSHVTALRRAPKQAHENASLCKDVLLFDWFNSLNSGFTLRMLHTYFPHTILTNRQTAKRSKMSLGIHQIFN